jgi:hypothetical protein
VVKEHPTEAYSAWDLARALFWSAWTDEGRRRWPFPAFATKAWHGGARKRSRFSGLSDVIQGKS